MGKAVKINLDELKKLEKSLIKIDKELDFFITELAKGLAARLLAKTIKRTPIGVYPSGTGKVGGTLRRGWTAGEKGIDVKNNGGTYEVTVKNDTFYASYVEYGHRQEVGRFVPAIGKKLKKAWVPGRFMLTISTEELSGDVEKIIKKKLKKLLEGKK